MSELPVFSSARTLIVGDLMLDRYWVGQTSRISLEAPVPIVQVCDERTSPGGAGNVALNVRALGGQVTLLGVTGDDQAAEDLAAQLSQAGIDTFIERQSSTATIIKLRVVSKHQQLLRLDFEQNYSAVMQDALQATFQAQLPQAKLVVLSDYAKGTLADPQPFITLAKTAGIPVLVDPKGCDFSRYRGAALLTPNYKEFTAVVGACETDEEMVQKAQQLLSACQIDALLITRGAQGMTLINKDQSACHLPALAHEVYDVTGAGDTVIAVLAAALATGADLSYAMSLANTAASVAVTRSGAVSISSDELQETLANHQRCVSGVLTDEQMLCAVSEARRHGERIVVVAGRFDVLHSELVDLLQRAGDSGERLLVIVNDDAGIHTIAQRMQVLAGLTSVDWVVSSAQDALPQLIERLAPDQFISVEDTEMDNSAHNTEQPDINKISAVTAVAY